MILPGTQIRVMAEEQRVMFQNKPPYYFLSGWNFTTDDIRYISDYVEDKTGLSRSVFFLPDFTDPADFIFTRGVVFNGDQPGSWDIGRYASITERYVMDLHVNCSVQETLYSGIEKILSSQRSSDNRLINLIIYSDIIIDEDILRRFMDKYETDSLHKRLNVFHTEAEASMIRFFQVSENISAYSIMDEAYCMVTPVYRITGESLNFTKVLHPESAVLVKAGTYGSVSTYLKKVYGAEPQFVAFQCENEMEQFYNDIGGEYISLPYNFGLVKA